ncbi:uncharacterized protein LOC142563108 isoform X2 [Dermacentor variabilis]|uniref:uncharacterized protein LOC142563108 isoform X2 n=1 Tax=Dermacentor variabilis TaxID=34621 RepID=UPI003F5B442F
MNEEPGDPCSRPDLPCRGDTKEGQSLSPSNSTREKGCSGCVCREGFRRSAFGECVAESDCRTCWRDPFSDYSYCGGCPPVCGEVYPAPCPRTCSPGCYCLDGFVRTPLPLQSPAFEHRPAFEAGLNLSEYPARTLMGLLRFGAFQRK